MDQAVAQYAEALRLNPDLAKAHNNLGLALAAQGQWIRPWPSMPRPCA